MSSKKECFPDSLEEIIEEIMVEIMVEPETMLKKEMETVEGKEMIMEALIMPVRKYLLMPMKVHQNVT